MKKILRTTAKWLGVILLILIVLILIIWLFLSFRSGRSYNLPRPTGSYHVGRAVYDWTDQSRTNSFVSKPNEKRELMAMSWYPTDQNSGQTAPYLPGNWLKAADKDQAGGALIKHKFASLKTNSYSDAKVANGKFPLIILQPGYGRVSADYTAIAEDLASQGYIVLSSSPTYISDLVVFDDGHAIKNSSQAALPENESGLSPKMLQATNRILNVWDGDISYLISQAEVLNKLPSDKFYDKIDMEKVAVIGHSLGGAAAYQACKTDKRCKLVVDMDGTLYGDTTKTSSVPVMFLSSDQSKNQGDAKAQANYTDNILKAQTQPTYSISLDGAAHFNFSDLALYSFKPVMRLVGAVGTIDARQGISLTNQYIEDMLGKYLNNQPSKYLDGKHKLSDSTVQITKQ